ncbi:murein DD-endopeptidase MepM/ murein hydrolase activator NlpD [Actinoplanes octamycinicus]|uniref:Murein DD-endopeptidase MepM/ murein hydrolase activator NlpD n=1 Tax=Actinoplanes octamycinicus TaxID=135948 RepID=A0A7W7M644_9ACTN|nr:M23 family metallopeptidase [Actinoplanes octamycinicus]MBB4738345.1 murein DD-endopeptidase MepM/ murein hydrolase activator NlpD [Actinoplanes octamycinicus]
MSSRALAAVAAAAAAILLACSGLTQLLGGAAAAGNCSVAEEPASAFASVATRPSRSGPLAPIGSWTSEQVGNAAIIAAVGARLKIPVRGQVIAVATAMQESRLINLAGGDRDSIGLFQQRPSQGWGTPAQVHDPEYAATRFYTKLQSITGWQSMPLTRAAQAVQVSAYPDAYAKWEPQAAQLVAALTGVHPAGPGCTTVIAASGWTSPAPGAEVGSGFRTADRPGHDGVDLIEAKGHPIHAAAAGTVTRVRCNAIDVRTGGDWGCNRDGDPDLTSGCGWYVDINHAGGIVTRYCHQLVRPYVQVGRHVNAGDLIGLSGSSGHSSGPHLHYEVHLNADHGAGSAINPVTFMQSVGAPLG